MGFPSLYFAPIVALMAELVDAADSKSVFARSGSSSLPRGTITLFLTVYHSLRNHLKSPPRAGFLVSGCIPLSMPMP